MKLLYSIKQKGRIIALLSIFLAIEILSNSSQTENVQQLDMTINEIYADRLIAQDLLFKMANSIDEQKMMLLGKNNQESTVKVIDQSAGKIYGFISSYDKTKLTADEELIFGKLKTKIGELNAFVAANKNQLLLPYVKSQYILQLDAVSNDLTSLSEIQVSRAKDLKTDSLKIVSFSAIIHELNWALSIITVLCIAALVFASKSIVSTFPQREQLN